jgi:GTP-binding protein Era
MVASAWGGASDADGVILLVGAKRGISADTRLIMDGLKKQNRQVMLGINKIDLVKKPILLDLAATLTETGLFTEIFMISAETGDGVDDLLDNLTEQLPQGPWMFPEDQISDMPSRLLAAEITREKVYLQLHQELPYAVTVETEKWEQGDDGSAKVNQIIYVQKPGQKAIVLGKGGAKIKKIGEMARKELEDLLGHRVHLFLFVKVRENWGEDPERYSDWGLDFNA